MPRLLMVGFRAVSTQQTWFENCGNKLSVLERETKSPKVLSPYLFLTKTSVADKDFIFILKKIDYNSSKVLNYAGWMRLTRSSEFKFPKLCYKNEKLKGKKISCLCNSCVEEHRKRLEYLSETLSTGRAISIPVLMNNKNN